MFISLLGSEVCGNAVSEDIKVNITEESLEELFELAKCHDLVPPCANVLFNKKLMPDGEMSEIYRAYLMMSLFRHQKQIYEFSRISELFEKEQIPYMPLKGLIIKELYNEQHLRTSCDLDILVKKEDLERASELLITNLNYENTAKGSHDWGFQAQNDVHLELHYELINKYTKDGAKKGGWTSDCLKDVWSTAVNDGSKKFRFKMKDELFYFYHIAHMAKHFECGGCGVKPFIDLWLINNKMNFDRTKCTALLEKEGLLKFENAMQHMVDVWFSGEKSDPVAEALGNFVFFGGVYGNEENFLEVQKNKLGGKLKCFFARVFLSYDYLRFQYPVLNKHRWLMPICQIARWFRLIFKGNFRRVVRWVKMIFSEETVIDSEGSTVEISDTKKLLSTLGLL